MQRRPSDGLNECRRYSYELKQAAILSQCRSGSDIYNAYSTIQSDRGTQYDPGKIISGKNFELVKNIFKGNQRKNLNCCRNRSQNIINPKQIFYRVILNYF